MLLGVPLQKTRHVQETMMTSNCECMCEAHQEKCRDCPPTQVFTVNNGKDERLETLDASTVKQRGEQYLAKPSGVQISSRLIHEPVRICQTVVKSLAKPVFPANEKSERSDIGVGAIMLAVVTKLTPAWSAFGRQTAPILSYQHVDCQTEHLICS